MRERKVGLLIDHLQMLNITVHFDSKRSRSHWARRVGVDMRCITDPRALVTIFSTASLLSRKHMACCNLNLSVEDQANTEVDFPLHSLRHSLRRGNGTKFDDHQIAAIFERGNERENIREAKDGACQASKLRGSRG